MKYNIILVFLLTFSFIACEKNNDSVKAELEKALPQIQITSMGLVTQVGPYATNDIIAVNFGGAITNAQSGSFDIAWYDVPAGSVQPKLIDSLHFKSWNDTIGTGNSTNIVNTTLTPTTYPNTSVFSGRLLLRLSKLPAAKPYTLALYARTANGNTARVSTTRFVTIK